MLFNSYQFLLFFPIVILIYYLIPVRARSIWLLVSSYYYYMCWDIKYTLLIVASTVVTYFCGLALDWIRGKCKCEQKSLRYCKLILVLCCLFNLGLLLFFKYFTWLADNINLLLGRTITLPFSIVLPIGISFYTFQALGYTIDVYRREIKAEKNFFRYALFVSFFPQLVAGPIGRAKNLMRQLECKRDFDYENVKSGFLLMLWGYFEKIVIADKAAILVDSVYSNYAEQHGAIIFVATVFFAIQLYCDFSGYSHIAIGAAKILNVNLMANFKQPYFALNIRDFWSRWHISLSTWFRDYLYIPLGGSRCSKTKKYCNLLITFLVSGLWHGASWHYVVWGLLHGVYQVLSDFTYKMRCTIINKLKIHTNCFSYRLMQRMITFLVVSFIWLFFRVETLPAAIVMCKKIFFQFNPTILLGEEMYNLGLSSLQLLFLLVAICILLFVDYLHEKGKSIRLFLNNQNFLFRWLVYYIAVLGILISALQTFGQDAGMFIYAQF